MLSDKIIKYNGSMEISQCEFGNTSDGYYSYILSNLF